MQPGLHPYGTHLGARVAPQRCPILRMSNETIGTNYIFDKRERFKIQIPPNRFKWEFALENRLDTKTNIGECESKLTY